MKFVTKHTEDLERVQQRLSLVVKSANLGLWDWNPQTNDVVFSERWGRMLGVEPEQLTQTLEDWTSRVHPDDLDGCFKDIEAHIKGETEFYSNTHRMRHSSGKWLYILDQGTVVERNDRGEPVRFTGTHTDVTHIVETEHRASEALKARDLFLSQITHDIRTPLHGILAACCAAENESLDGMVKNLIDIIQSSGKTLIRLVDDILDNTQIQSGSLSVVLEKSDVRQIVQNVLALENQHAKAKGLDLEFIDFELAPVYCSIDTVRFSQIIENLLSNAIKYTDNGKIMVAFKVVKESLQLRIEDTGIGMENPAKMFEAFSRESDINRRDSHGLGLYIVKNLCDAMDIAIHVESEVGEGSCFTLKIPLWSATLVHEDISDERQKNPIKSVRTTKRSKCLLVDDNATNLFVGQVILQRYFDDVVIFDNPANVIDYLEDNSAGDVIFVDKNMPHLNGIELASAIRQLAISPEPLIVCQTADAQTNKIYDNEYIFDEILVKPFDGDSIVRVLNNLNIH